MDIIQALEAGQFLKIGEISLELETPSHLIVRAWSIYSLISSITKNSSIQELSEIRQIFNDITNESADLQDYLLQKDIEYRLSFNDSGRVSFDICSEKHGAIEWFIDLPT